MDAYSPEYYDALKDHAFKALRDGKPFVLNADAVISLVAQAKEDRMKIVRLEANGIKIP